MNNNGDVKSKSKSESESTSCGPASPPPKQPWDVEIDVYLTKACPDPVFDIQTTLPVDPVTDDIIFKNNRRPGFNIKFNLYDQTGPGQTSSGYVFPPQPRVREACWSQRGTSCPKSPIWEVFDPRRVTNHGTTLEVYNKNPSAENGGPLGLFKYTLRVTNDDGASYCDLDPGGNDSNGQDN